MSTRSSHTKAHHAPEDIECLEYALQSLYATTIGQGGELSATGHAVVSHFFEDLLNDGVQSLERFLKARPFISERIRQRRSYRPFFCQPVVLAVYYLAEHHAYALAETGLIPDGVLALVFSDLGRAAPC